MNIINQFGKYSATYSYSGLFFLNFFEEKTATLVEGLAVIFDLEESTKDTQCSVTNICHSHQMTTVDFRAEQCA
jgi:hypothetical protein